MVAELVAIPPVGLAVTAALLLVTSVDQQNERNLKYAQGLAESRARGKPFLVVGRPKGGHAHGCGDICLDIDPRVAQECPVVKVADVRSIPLADGFAGAAFASHVLEHLPSVEDAMLAWRELHRVADVVLVAGPRPLNPIARMVPDHSLWCYQRRDGSLYIEHRTLWGSGMRGSCFADHPLRVAVVGTDLSVRLAIRRRGDVHYLAP